MNARIFENLRKDDASRSAKGLTRTYEWRPQKKNPSVCSFILKILALRGTRASQRVIHLTNKIELGILANEGALYSEIERKKGEQRVKPKSL